MVRGAGYRFVGELHELEGAPPKATALPPANAGIAEPLVGRERVLAALSGALDDCVAGRGRLVILGGEPGIGKTRCARELSRLAQARGVPALLSRCLEQEGVPALWPFVQLLRQAADHNRDAAPEIERVLGELQPGDSQRTRSGAPYDRSLERFWSFDRVARVLRQAATPAGLVLVIDDLQWADGSSLQQLERCMADLDQSRVLIVATLREPRPSTEPVRERALRRLSRAATVIELGGLSQTETEELVRQVKGSHATKLAADLHRRSAGNPFFLCELLRSLSDAELTAGTDTAASAPRPRVIRDMILGRLDGLGDDALTVLRAASTLGTEVEVATLRAVVDLSAERFMRALEPLLEQRLLTRSASLERCAFSHDLVREVVYAQLEEVERVRYHRRAAEALAARANASPVEIAYHFHRALTDGVHEQALRYALSAGTHCMDTLAFETAARCYRWGLAALDFHAATDPVTTREPLRVRAEVMLQLGVAILAIGRSTDAVQVLRDAAQVADRGGCGELVARAGTWLR
jgi:predicted ATPase